MVTQANLASMYRINMDNLAGGNTSSLWTSYSSSGMLAGFNLAKSLGFNTVMIGVRPQTGAFDFPNPTAPELANLTDACNQAATAGIRLHVRMFRDWAYLSGDAPYNGVYPYANWGTITAAQTWAGAVIGAIQASNLVFASTLSGSTVYLESYSECPFSNSTTYAGTFDGGYTGSTSPTPSNGTVVTTFAQIMTPWMRSQTGGLVVCSPLTLTDFSSGVASMSGSQIPDWWDYHSYPGGSYSALHSDMSSAFAISGSPLFIGETGAISIRSGMVAQAQWLQNARAASQTIGLGEPAPWQLYDEGPAAANYGLYDSNGVERPAAYLYGHYPLGVNVPQIGTDRFFTVGGVRERLVGPAY